MEQINEFIKTAFKHEAKGYPPNSGSICGGTKHIIQSIQVSGPSNPGRNGVGCLAMGGLSPAAVQALNVIESAVNSSEHKTLEDLSKAK